MDTHSILDFSASNFPKDLALHRNGNGSGDSILRSNENNLSIPSVSFSEVRLLPCVYFAFSLTRLLSPSVSFLVQESATAPDPGQYDLTTSPVWLNLLRALCATSWTRQDTAALQRRWSDGGRSQTWSRQIAVERQMQSHAPSPF